MNLVLIESTLREPQDDSSFHDERKPYVMLRFSKHDEMKHNEPFFNRIYPSPDDYRGG